jgi:hypothetical protein
MTSGLLPKLPQAVMVSVVLAVASASFNTAHAEDKPGFFKKLFGGGSKTETPPAPEPKPKAEPPKTTSKTSTSSKPPRVIITTTGGSKKKVELTSRQPPHLPRRPPKRSRSPNPSRT